MIHLNDGIWVQGDLDGEIRIIDTNTAHQIRLSVEVQEKLIAWLRDEAQWRREFAKIRTFEKKTEGRGER